MTQEQTTIVDWKAYLPFGTKRDAEERGISTNMIGDVSYAWMSRLMPVMVSQLQIAAHAFSKAYEGLTPVHLDSDIDEVERLVEGADNRVKMIERFGYSDFYSAHEWRDCRDIMRCMGDIFARVIGSAVWAALDDNPLRVAALQNCNYQEGIEALTEAYSKALTAFMDLEREYADMFAVKTEAVA